MTAAAGARMFVALPLPDDAREHLETFLEPRRGSENLRWVAADQLHLTLAFCASVPDRALEDLDERLTRAAAKRSAFDVSVAGGGAFPGVVRARVLWAGLDLDHDGPVDGPVDAAVELDRLAVGVRAAASRAGIAVDGARFRPHVTLARLRVPADATRWVRLLESYAGPVWRAERVELVESFLGQGPRGRPRHEVRATYWLTDRDR